MASSNGRDLGREARDALSAAERRRVEALASVERDVRQERYGGNALRPLVMPGDVPPFGRDRSDSAVTAETEVEGPIAGTSRRTRKHRKSKSRSKPRKTRTRSKRRKPKTRSKRRTRSRKH